MKFNYKNRGFIVLSLSLMLIAVGVVNYQLSKDSTLSVSDEFKAYEQAQIDKNSSDKDTTLVDSKEYFVVDKDGNKTVISAADAQKGLPTFEIKVTGYAVQASDITEEQATTELINLANAKLSTTFTAIK